MNPLTPDHHFYIDQGTNARLRIVAVAIGRKLVEAGLARRPGGRDLPPATTSFGSSWRTPTRSTPARSSRIAVTSASALTRSGRANGSGRRPRQPSTSRTTRSGASRRSSTASRSRDDRRPPGPRRVARDRGGDGALRRLARRVRPGAGGRDPRLPDDESGLGGALHEDRGSRHRRRRRRLAPRRRRRASSGSRPSSGRRTRRSGSRPGIACGSTEPPASSRSWRDRRRAARSCASRSRMCSSSAFSRASTRPATASSRPGSRRSSARARRPCGRRCASSSALRFVETEPFSGARVRAVSPLELAEAYPVRAALEELAASRGGRPHRRRCRGARGRARGDAGGGQGRRPAHARSRTTSRFHRKIVAAAGNQILLEVWSRCTSRPARW